MATNPTTGHVTDDSAKYDQSAADEAMESLATLAALGNELERLKDEAVTAKVEVERRMDEARKQLQGDDREQRPAKAPAGGEVSGPESRYPSQDNITLRLTTITASRWADMCFPTNDRNFEVKPTPVPDLVKPLDNVVTVGGEPLPVEGADGTQRPMTEKDVALVMQEAADKAAAIMQKQIDDDLTECHFNAHAREAIDDACAYGTGILKGPFVVNKPQKVRKKSQFVGKDGQIGTLWEIGYTQKKKPACSRVDPWDFFPQRSRRIEEAEHAFVRHTLTGKQLDALAKQPGFNAELIAQIKRAKPNKADPSRGGAEEKGPNEGRYTIWEYHGPFPKKAMAAMGCPCDEESESIYGEVWFSGGIVAKVAMSHLESQDRLPFYVINYQRDPNDIFGFGVPWIVRYDQNAIHTLWDAMIVNGVLSSGVIIALIKGALSKDQGNIKIGVNPVEVLNFSANDLADMDVSKAIQDFSVESTLDKTMPLYERVKANAEEHAMIPFVVQGDVAKAYGTAYGTQQLMNSTNIVQRRFARTTDDDLIVPLIEAFYDWEMLHGDNDAAKGDYCVKALGISYLLKKELEALNFYTFLGGPAKDPSLAANYNQRWLAEMAVTVLDLPADQALVSKEQAAQNAQNQPPPPEVQIAMEKEKTAQATIAFKENELKFQMKKWDDEYKLRTFEAQGKVIAADAKADAQFAAIAANKDVKLEKIAVDTALKDRELKTKQFTEGADITLRAKEIESRNAKTEASVSPMNPS